MRSSTSWTILSWLGCDCCFHEGRLHCQRARERQLQSTPNIDQCVGEADDHSFAHVEPRVAPSACPLVFANRDRAIWSHMRSPDRGTTRCIYGGCEGAAARRPSRQQLQMLTSCLLCWHTMSRLRRHMGGKYPLTIATKVCRRQRVRLMGMGGLGPAKTPPSGLS
jgi:hypothetical protein